jgi:hypothetical protein
MRESSYRTACTSQAIPKPRAETTKSLSGDILAISPCRSIFCPEPITPNLGKVLKTDILAGTRKKKCEIYIQPQIQD